MSAGIAFPDLDSVPLSSNPAADSGRWTSSVLIGLLFAAAAMVYSLVLASLIYGHHFWMQPMDVWLAVDGGRYVWDGAFGYVYQGSGAYALPLSFILMAPAAGLIDHFRLVEGAPLAVPHPSAWLLVGPYSLLFGVFLLHAVRCLAWSLGVRSRLVLIQLAAVVIVLVPAFEWGHFEDVVALAFALHAARKLIAAEWIPAAFLLSVAISAKQSFIVLLPLFVMMSPAGKRLRTLMAAAALPGALAAYVLGVDWHDASRALFSPVNVGPAAAQGHLAFYATWLGSKTSQASRTLGVVVATALAWPLRRAATPAKIMAAVGLLLLVRPFSEAINYSYYWSPALLFAALAAATCARQFRLGHWVSPAAAVLWALPRGNAVTSSWWWMGEMILLAASAATLSAELLGVGVLELPRFAAIGVKKSAAEPILKLMETARPMGERSWTR